MMSKKEGYPEDWMHCTIHLNPKTGEMHSDGDHRVRHWIQERLTARNEKLEVVYEAADALLHTDNPVTHELLWLGKVVGEAKTTEQNDD